MIAPTRLAHAAGLLTSARSALTNPAFELAYHIAVPVVVTPTFVHLVRTNFFLDPPAEVTYEDEARLLLSALCREVGQGLYDIDPDLRALLLVGLTTRFGADRLRSVASLLERYTAHGDVWGGLPELEQAQRLTALSLLRPAVARAWLDTHETIAETDPQLGPEWCVAMRRRIHDQPRPERRLAEEIAWTWCGPATGGTIPNAAALRALASLPGVDRDGVVSALRDIRRGTAADDDQLDESVRTVIAALTDVDVAPARPADVPFAPLITQRWPVSGAASTVPQRTAATAQPDATDSTPSTRIMIVGAPGAGKTTFLVSLSLAAMSHGTTGTPWTLYRSDVDDAAATTLRLATDRLAHGRFPARTPTDPLRFRLVGEVGERTTQKGWAGTRTPRRQVSCIVEVFDGLLPRAGADPGAAPVDPIAQLAATDGVVYLIDPTTELTAGPGQGSGFEYGNALLQALTSELYRQGRLDHGRLPQHVAVCLTKLDDPLVFEPLVAAGLVRLSDSRGPYVPDDRAADCLDWLGSTAPSQSNVSLLLDALRHAFPRPG
ncbi:hypothetical protein [Dactylosporangium cerinum]